MCILSMILVTCNCGMVVLTHIFIASCCCIDSLSVHNVLLMVYFIMQMDKDIARLSAILADSKPTARKLAQRVQQLVTKS